MKERYLIEKNGSIDTNGWLILFTSKNQHLYVLKKQGDGKWKVYDDAKSSAGYDCGGHYNYYLTSRFRDGIVGGNEVYAFKHWEPWRSEPYIYSNAIHPSTAGISNSRPTSAGCIHGGNPGSHILKSIHKAGLGTKLIIY